MWAEADLVLADEFRDGNVPAKQDPSTCAKLAFAALPETVTRRYFRGDSACHEHDLLEWLKHPDREKEPGGRIGFAVSAVMSEPLGEAIRKVGETEWKTFGEAEEDGTDRHFHAVITNERTEGGRLLEWQREKAGTVEHTHDEVKNELGGEVVRGPPAMGHARPHYRMRDGGSVSR